MGPQWILERLLLLAVPDNDRSALVLIATAGSQKSSVRAESQARNAAFVRLRAWAREAGKEDPRESGCLALLSCA